MATDLLADIPVFQRIGSMLDSFLLIGVGIYFVWILPRKKLEPPAWLTMEQAEKKRRFTAQRLGPCLILIGVILFIARFFDMG